jgi:putative ABC transport system permease protein
LTIDPDLPVFGITSMDQLMADSVAARRFIMLVLAVFAALSLILASVGIYGVISYGTQQRLSEFAVRMALGASRGSILTIVLSRGMSLAFVGIGIGLAGALVLSRNIETLLFDIEATDPSTFVSVSVLFAAVSLLACYLPASRATRVDPMQTLRQE